MKKIFIASSEKARTRAQTIDLILKNLGVVTLPWYKAFPPGDITIDTLIGAAHECSGGVFILDKDDQLVIKEATNTFEKKSKYIPRDNVIAEAGLFAGVLGRKSVALCLLPGVHKCSDFEGITHIAYNPDNIDLLEKPLKFWLDKNVQDYRIPKSANNVAMLSRQEIHELYTIDDRFHFSDGAYKKIKRIRMMNFASNLAINPSVADRAHSTAGTSLHDALQKVLKETKANFELILADPNPCNLADAETKIANRNAGSVKKIILSALFTIYKNLTNGSIYQQSAADNRFHLYVMKVGMPFAIFNIEFFDEEKKYNHVKIDLYSASLGNEDDRRSFIIWQMDDPLNYQFFVDNFKNIRGNSKICSPLYKKTLMKLIKSRR